MTGVVSRPAVETDGLRLSEDEVMAVIGVRRRPWPTSFLTMAEQSGQAVDPAQGRRMVERGAISLVARGAARVIDGRFVLSGAVSRMLDPLDSPSHTVVFSGPSDSPTKAQAPVVRFNRHGLATFVDSASSTGIRTIRIASDEDCTAQLIESASAVFTGHDDHASALHVVNPGDHASSVTTVVRGRVITRVMTAQGQWGRPSASPFFDRSLVVAGFSRSAGP